MTYPLFTPHKADADADAFRRRYGPQMAYLTERLGVPPADKLYRVNETRLAQRPRLDFADHSVADLRRRAADPRFAAVTARVHAFAARIVGATPPPAIVLDAHDPNRPFADGLAWMAMSFLIDTDDARRGATLAGLRRWLAAFRAWGPMTTNLSLAQSTLAQTRVYDWLHDILPTDELAALRAQIVLQVRLSLDESRGGLSMWRGQRLAANHNWAQHSARAFAALALWGEDSESGTGILACGPEQTRTNSSLSADTDRNVRATATSDASDHLLAPGELRAWLDDALVNFTMVQQTHAHDGAPLEGACYQDYGLRFYVDFSLLADTLLHVKESFFDDDIRLLSNRLFVLLPDRKGSMVYADGLAYDWWGTCSQFRRLASHYRDERFQLMADLNERCGDARALPDWRSLLAYDPELPAAPIESLPLHHDFADFGLYTARGGWGTEAAFFGLRCGPASAESVAARLGFDFGESHLLPNQGDFSFFLWGKFILPGCEYPKLKLTSNHNVVVFEGRDAQAGRLVGQLGEGGPWFNAAGADDPDRDYANRASTPRVVRREHTALYHHYLCELGGLYRLRDERAADGVFFPEYTRSLVFLPAGAVAVVDRVRTPHPRTAHFRLLTAVDRLTADEHGFAFDLWGVPGRIDDYSPVAFARSVAVEHLSAQTNADQRVATLRAENTTEAVFAVVIGVGAGTRHRITTDATGYDLLDGDGARLLRVDWPYSR